MKKIVRRIVIVVVLIALAIIYRPNKGTVPASQNDTVLGDSDNSNEREDWENLPDGDLDGDGIPNSIDPDMDGDGIFNEEDSDIDGDGIPNEEDGGDLAGSPNDNAGNDDDSEEDAPADGTAVNLNTQGFVSYDSVQVQKAAMEGKKVALFFHASRCPSCRSLAQNIQENIDTIDADTIIYQVDYDTQVALKQKYGIVSQHTIVYLDQNLEAKKISKGIPTLNDLLANF